MVLVKTLVCMISLLLLWPAAVPAAELDDSSLYIEAFHAYQKKDFLRSIELMGQMQQMFPDSPLRDVSLLILARSAIKSGDNELAGKMLNKFLAEFPSSPLKSTIEEDLQSLGIRIQKGETIAPNQQLRAAAQKVRNDFIAEERAAAEKLAKERQARELAEKERIAREKAEAERKERERIAAEKLAKESIKLAITFTGSGGKFQVGTSGELPFELANTGKNREEFQLALMNLPPEYGARIASALKPAEPLARVALQPGEKFRGIISFRLPVERVDGYRLLLSLKATSVKYADVSFNGDAQAVASAPLIRAVAKFQKSRPVPGDVTRYRVTVLNVGSLQAQGLTVRVTLPELADLVDAGTDEFRQESARVLVFRLDKLETGMMKEYGINVKIRDDARDGYVLRSQVEVVNGALQLKETFIGMQAEVQQKK